MALTVGNEGEDYILKAALGKAAPEVLTLRLATAGTISETMTAASFTEVGAIMGYAAVALNGANWVLATDGSQNTDASYPEVTFTFTAGAGVTCTHYYITNASGKVIWAEALTPNAAIPAGGGTVKITPKLRLD